VDQHDEQDEPEGGQPDRSGLVAIMRRMAAGDEAAAVTLYERHGAAITGAVRHVVRLRRRRLDHDEIDELVQDVCFELQKVAHRWSPEGGALPWVWARHRVANVVDRHLGQWSEPLDEARLAELETAPAASPAGLQAADGRSLLDTLAGVASGAVTPARVVPDMSSAKLLLDALDEARISARDRELLLEYSCEKHSGNASPAATVAPVFGMKEPSVRQAFRRVRERLLRLAATDERFAPLADLPLLA
jgi:DNA-directed RNA polymerase specialized sigma24 family protein